MGTAVYKPLSQGVQKMPISGIRYVMDLAARYPDVIHLEVGQPDFTTPQHIIDAAYRAACEGYTSYTPNAGLDSLRELCAEKVRGENGIETTPDRVLITVGSEGAVASTFVALVDPGDEVLIPEPGWTNFRMLTLARNAIPVPYPLSEEEDYIPDPRVLERLVTDRTKLLVVNSPANPTGAVYPAEVIEALVELANRHGLYLLSDEAYEKLVFSGEHVSPGRFDAEGRVISAFSFSKTYAMTGWRVGFAVAPPEVARAMIQLQEPYYSCAPSISQKAAEAALSGPQDCVAAMVASYARRHRLAVERLREAGLLGYQPRGSFFFLVNIAPTEMDAFAFARACLEEARVAVAPGSTFGERAAGTVRLSIAAPEERLPEGVERLIAFIQGRCV
ncbi:MAG: aspartate aminotransferase [Candidatus Poribacteria bacterium]|nr:MAG: aspartate aminotransferase [Candidatus Poribacteria bacterium]